MVAIRDIYNKDFIEASLFLFNLLEQFAAHIYRYYKSYTN